MNYVGDEIPPITKIYGGDGFRLVYNSLPSAIRVELTR